MPEDTPTPRERAMFLAGQIKANETRAAHLSDTIGSLTQAMYAANQQVLADRAELRTIQRAHYADMEADAVDQAQGRADDFRIGGSAA